MKGEKSESDIQHLVYIVIENYIDEVIRYDLFFIIQDVGSDAMTE